MLKKKKKLYRQLIFFGSERNCRRVLSTLLCCIDFMSFEKMNILLELSQPTFQTKMFKIVTGNFNKCKRITFANSVSLKPKSTLGSTLLHVHIFLAL